MVQAMQEPYKQLAEAIYCVDANRSVPRAGKAMMTPQAKTQPGIICG